jgi:hypothetical protein
MKDKAQVMEQRNHTNLSWFTPQEAQEDDFLLGKTPVYLEDTWEEE